MPRQRGSKAKATNEASTTSNTSNENEVSNPRRMKMALTPDQVRAIYAKRRTKGLYLALLGQFIESGDSGVSVKEEWADLADKKATSLKQGFENAKEKKDAPEGSDTVDVIVDGEDVFLINRAVYNVEDLETATASA